MKTILKGNALGRRYSISEISGIVQGSETRSVVEASTAEASTHFDQTLFLCDSDGKQRTIELGRMRLSCREGDSVTLWLLKSSSIIESQAWLAAKNSTRGGEVFGSVYNCLYPMRSVIVLTLLFSAIPIAFGFVSGQALSGFASAIWISVCSFIVLGLCGVPLGFMRASKVQSVLNKYRTGKT